MTIPAVSGSDNVDNLLSKAEPFVHNFNDSTCARWTQSGPSTWSAETGYLTKTTSGWSAMYRPNTDPDMDVRFSYCDNDADTGSGQAFVRYVDWDNYVAVTIVGGSMMLYKKVGGSLTTTTNSSATSTEGVWYDVRVVMDGQNISVLRAERGSGQEMTQVLSTSSAPVTTTARLQFVNGTNASFAWDNIMAVSDDMSTTSTYAYDDANELLTMSVAGTAQTFTYDDWGRTSTRTQSANSRQATYTYRFGDKLFLVESNFFDEAASTSFVFDGLGKRRITGDGTNALKWYRWGFGWNVLAEYDSDGSGTKIGTQTREYFGQAEAVGTGYASYTWRYYVKDHLGSTRALYDANKASLGHYDYSPYGDAYLHTGADITHLYTGHDWTSRIGLYFAPYRYYNPAAGRWITRDPAGMVDGTNLYGYIGGDVINETDPTGLWGKEHGCYCGLDQNPLTSPWVQPWLHFSSRAHIEPLLEDAVANCDWRKFKRRMHRLQDSFSHYMNGYRWYTGGHVPATVFCGKRPDDSSRPENAGNWALAESARRTWEGRWRAKCGDLPEE